MKKLPLINLAFILILVTFVSLGWKQISSLGEKLKFQTATSSLSESQYTFIIREIDTTFTITIAVFSVLLGITALFVNYGFKETVSATTKDLQNKYKEYESKYESQRESTENLKGDLHMVAYYNLRLDVDYKLDKETDYNEISQYYLAMAERISLAITSYRNSGTEVPKEWYDYLNSDLFSLFSYVDALNTDFVPDKLSYNRFLTLQENINLVGDVKISKLLHSISKKLSFQTLGV